MLEMTDNKVKLTLIFTKLTRGAGIIHV